jgi:oligopeptide/dipeptide ABC transporter ATP-binding protein
MDDEFITLDSVSVHFRSRSNLGLRRSAVHALDKLSLTISMGEVLGIVGESGCGKSTLGRVILGLQMPTDGSVYVDGKRVPHARPGVNAKRYGFQIVFQDSASSLNPRMRVNTIIAEPLADQKLIQSRLNERIKDVLRDVGLDPSFVERYPEELSGGQQQRVAIARALAPHPRLIVLDEAASALDTSTQAQVLNLLKDLKDKQDVTYVFISHDIATVKFMSTRVAVMYLGEIVEILDPALIDKSALHPYTICLRSAVPFPDPIVERSRTRIVPQGPVPSLISPPPACRFHTRCPIAQPKCSIDKPALARVDGARYVACHYVGQFEALFDRSGGTG